MEEQTTEEQEEARAAFADASEKQLVSLIFNAADELERRGEGKALRAVFRDRIKLEQKKPLTLAQMVIETINTHEGIERECCVDNCNAMITGIDAILQLTLPNPAARAFAGHRIVKALADTVRVNTGVYPIQVMHDQTGHC